MANATSTAIGNQQLYNDLVLKGYVATVAPLRAFSLDVSPAPVQKGQAINITFTPSGSAAVSFVAGTGYTMAAANRIAKTVTLSNQYFVGTGLTDIEMANSSLVRLEQQALMDGRALGLTVLQNIIANITASNFTNGYNVNSSSLYTLSQLGSIRKAAGNLFWGPTRNIVLNVNAYAGLLGDTAFQYIYRGKTDVQATGVITDALGWGAVYEAPGYVTGQVSGSNKQVGFAATPDALLVGMRYLQPDPAAQGIVDAYPVTDPASGITIGFRKWYDANQGQVKSVYECVWGAAVGNPSAAINLTATIDL